MNNSLQTSTNLRERLKLHEREIILEAIETNRSRRAQAASLGLANVTYWRRLRSHGLINGPDAPA